MDLARVRALFGIDCQCHRKGCFKKFKDMEADIKAFLDMFWSLEKPAQDAFDRNLVTLELENIYYKQHTVLNKNPRAPHSC